MRASLSFLLLAILPAIAFANPDDDIPVFEDRDFEDEVPIGALSSGGNSTLFDRSLPEGQDIYNVGIMMPRGDLLSERDVVEPRGAVEEWSNFPVQRDLASGEYTFPQSYDEAKRMVTASAESVKRGLLDKVRLTWYSGADLKNPSCGDWRLGGKWSPNNSNMICALTATWTAKGGKPKCGSFLKLTTRNKKSIIVRVVDSCAGSAMSPSNSCTRGMKVVDLTQAAFSKLASLNQGIIDGVTISVVSKPGGKKWSKSDTRIYGPQHF